MNFRIASALLLVLLLSAATMAQQANTTPDITSADLLRHVQRLSSDAWEGRGTGTEGEKKATEYIAAHFARLGLEPAGDDGTFFQKVGMPGGVKLGECVLALVDDKKTTLVLNKDFRPFGASASGKVEGDVVFAGYGITAPGMAYDDYKDLDVSGKIVVVFRHNPRGRTWRGRQIRRHAAFTAKFAQAVKRGAIGVVIVNNPNNFPSKEEASKRGTRRVRADVVHRGGVGGYKGPVVPFVHMTLAAARRVFPALFGATPDELEKAIHAGDAPAPASRPGKVRVRMALEVHPITLVGRNVCALLKPDNKNAVDEIVVVGGHHDHLGRGGSGSSLERDVKKRNTIHNGADDNASGTSGVLEVAEYMAARRQHLRRSILFMTFTGEERGLVGSRFFVNAPTIPFDKVVAMINMDMIGRLDGKKLWIGGVGTSPVFMPMIKRVNETIGLDMQTGAGGRAPSDNTSFYNKGKPVLFFFSGMHPDYHRPSDDWDKIDGAGMERIARLAGGLVDELARSTAPIPFTKADTGGSGPPRAVIGISAAAAKGGVGIGGVVDGGPAAKAGLLAGDIIVQINDRKITNIRNLRGALRRKNAGDKIKVKVLRDGKPIEVELTLAQG